MTFFNRYEQFDLAQQFLLTCVGDQRAVDHAVGVAKRVEERIAAMRALNRQLPASEDHLLAAAVLHDVLEDGWATVADLNAYGFCSAVVFIVIGLTRNPWDEYREYILGLTPAQAFIKGEDSRENLSHPETLGSLEGRYLRSLAYLERHHG